MLPDEFIHSDEFIFYSKHYFLLSFLKVEKKSTIKISIVFSCCFHTWYIQNVYWYTALSQKSKIKKFKWRIQVSLIAIDLNILKTLSFMRLKGGKKQYCCSLSKLHSNIKLATFYKGCTLHPGAQGPPRPDWWQGVQAGDLPFLFPWHVFIWTNHQTSLVCHTTLHPI